MKPRNVILVALGVAGLAAIYLAVRTESPSAPAAPNPQAKVQTEPAQARPPTTAPALAAVPQQAARVPAYHATAAAARPLPATLSPDLFAAIPVVARAYRIAKRIPEVLAQQPCYCHCDRMGHVGLLDCYRSDHGAG